MNNEYYVQKKQTIKQDREIDIDIMWNKKYNKINKRKGGKRWEIKELH